MQAQLQQIQNWPENFCENQFRWENQFSTLFFPALYVIFILAICHHSQFGVL